MGEHLNAETISFTEYLGQHLVDRPANKRLSAGAWKRLNAWLKGKPDHIREFFLYLHPGHLISLIIAECEPKPIQSENSDQKLRNLDQQFADAFRARQTPVVDLDADYHLYDLSLRHADDSVLNSFIMEVLDSNGQWIGKASMPQGQEYSLYKTEMLNHYLSGSTDTREADAVLEKLASEATSVYRLAELKARIEVYSRHITWAPVILKAASMESTFTFVGSNHLYGKDGLLEQFRQNGISVTRLVNCQQALVGKD